jgi:hypothetical protein
MELAYKNHDPSVGLHVCSFLGKWGDLRLKRFFTNLSWVVILIKMSFILPLFTALLVGIVFSESLLFESSRCIPSLFFLEALDNHYCPRELGRRHHRVYNPVWTSRRCCCRRAGFSITSRDCVLGEFVVWIFKMYSQSFFFRSIGQSLLPWRTGS